MPDATSIAIVLCAMAAASLLARLWRAVGRWTIARRLRRSLRVAVRRELGHETGNGFLRVAASRPVPGPGDEGMAA